MTYNEFRIVMKELLANTPIKYRFDNKANIILFTESHSLLVNPLIMSYTQQKFIETINLHIIKLYNNHVNEPWIIKQTEFMMRKFNE